MHISNHFSSHEMKNNKRNFTMEDQTLIIKNKIVNVVLEK